MLLRPRLLRQGLAPTCLELEITEGMIMRNAEKACELLRQIHANGVQLSIDDFGTGYSSLAYLKRFTVQTLKIDQSFVRDITTDADDAGIVTGYRGDGEEFEARSRRRRRRDSGPTCLP
jgi:EAL domain-containing protein (putative c-di-GMP-specific phosphodiesterase class I)